jgi:uncharacterized protein (DUF433 family)
VTAAIEWVILNRAFILLSSLERTDLESKLAFLKRDLDRDAGRALCYQRSMNEISRTVAGYRWIVVDPDLLGGQPAIRGTRLSVAHVLACLAEGMSAVEIATDYPGFPAESISEVLRFAAQHLERHCPMDVAP